MNTLPDIADWHGIAAKDLEHRLVTGFEQIPSSREEYDDYLRRRCAKAEQKNLLLHRKLQEHEVFKCFYAEQIKSYQQEIEKLKSEIFISGICQKGRVAQLREELTRLQAKFAT